MLTATAGLASAGRTAAASLLPASSAPARSSMMAHCRAEGRAEGRPSSGGRRTGGGRSGGRGGGGRGGRGRRSFNNCDQAAPTDRQVAFSGPFPQDPVTAIIGGGLSGLVCAQELARRGLRSVVFDTGEHGVGGRLATRSSADGSLKDAPPGLVFDHAAQFFTATDPAFQAMVDRWERAGVVRRWEGPVGELRDGRFAPLDAAGGPRYVAAKGMRWLATHLAGQASQALKQAQGSGGGSVMDGLVEVRRPQWVSDARHTRDGAEGWRLEGRGREQGVFDAVVIAHNGKCANRLAAPMGVPSVHSQLRRLKLSANWALLVAFSSPVPVPAGMEGAFIRGSEQLSWAGNNTAKLGLPAAGPECWTFFSTQEFGRANKVPQENVPREVSERVTREMLAAFERSLGLPQGSLPPVVYSRTQLWGAALPINSPRVPCIWDPAGRVGVCGDWVLQGGSMQAAALSGAAMAERIDASRGRRPDDIADLAQGLTTPLRAAGGEEIGQFPLPGGQQQGGQQAQQHSQQQRGAGSKGVAARQAGGAARSAGRPAPERPVGKQGAAAERAVAGAMPSLLERPRMR